MFKIKKNKLVHSINNTYIAYIHNRPSKIIKTPYLGDCSVYTNESNKNNIKKLEKIKCQKLNVINDNILVLPSLGTCGLTESGKFIIVTPKISKTAKSKF